MADQNVATAKAWLSSMVELRVRHILSHEDDGSVCPGFTCTDDLFEKLLDTLPHDFALMVLSQLCIEAGEDHAAKLTPDQAARLRATPFRFMEFDEVVDPDKE